MCSWQGAPAVDVPAILKHLPIDLAIWNQPFNYRSCKKKPLESLNSHLQQYIQFLSALNPFCDYRQS